MPTPERTTFSITDMAVWILLPMLIGGAVVFAVMRSMAGPGDDRPPIIVSDGSIKIQEADSADDSTTTSAKGTLTDVTGSSDPRKTWRHNHGNDAPKQLHVLVEGADTTSSGNCPVMYFARNITAATIQYGVTSVTRDVIVSMNTGKQPIDISLHPDATVSQTSAHAIIVDGGNGAKLSNVRITWGKGNSATSVDCKFGGALPPRLVFLQGK